MRPTKFHIREWLGADVVLVDAQTEDGRRKTMVLKALAWGDIREPTKDEQNLRKT